MAHDRYKNFLDDETVMREYFYPLQSVWVPFENGVMKLASSEESDTGSLLFKFYFQFNIETIIEFRWEKIIFHIDDKIGLVNIRNYHIPTFVNFMEKQKFILMLGPDEKFSELTRKSFFFRKDPMNIHPTNT